MRLPRAILTLKTVEQDDGRPKNLKDKQAIEEKSRFHGKQEVNAVTGRSWVCALSHAVLHGVVPVMHLLTMEMVHDLCSPVHSVSIGTAVWYDAQYCEDYHYTPQAVRL